MLVDVALALSSLSILLWLVVVVALARAAKQVRGIKQGFAGLMAPPAVTVTTAPTSAVATRHEGGWRPGHSPTS